MPQDFDREVLARLPLAEAVLSLWQFICADEHLDVLYNRHRGGTYEKKITFPLMVQLVRDALLEPDGSGHQSFRHAQQDGTLHAALSSAYDKLGHLPTAVSEAFLAEGADRLRQVLPDTPALADPRPASLRGFEVLVLDGKVVKRVPRRLQPTRQRKGGLLGGKGLAALHLGSGLVVALATDPDGEANDARLVPAVLPQVRALVQGPRLWLADRQFCDLTQTAGFTAEVGDHFLVRYHSKVHFCADPTRAVQHGQDSQGRACEQEWGWLGREGNKKRRYVRRITLHRPGEEDILLVTDLLEAVTYPAEDLLALYLARWGIERVFQQITEVFHLNRLIATTPQGTLFQLSFCLLLYNLLQVVRGYVAVGQQRAVDTISTELLFVDVTKQLGALHELVAVDRVVEFAWGGRGGGLTPEVGQTAGDGVECMLGQSEAEETQAASTEEGQTRTYLRLSPPTDPAPNQRYSQQYMTRKAVVPLTLSQGLLGEATCQLRQVFPNATDSLPASLEALEVVAFDGKKIKFVAKRLKCLRVVRGQVLGGKLLVAQHVATGLAVAIQADADGEASDNSLVSGAVAQVRQYTPDKSHLWVGDRAFCDLKQIPVLKSDGDHFLLRYHPKTHFYRDEGRSVPTGVDSRGLPYTEEWGWLGAADNAQRQYVRRITLHRPEQEAIIVVTDLLDGVAYPAADLLETYRRRWGIEKLFQRVTEVFDLRHLIGSTPQATVFQAAFCFLLSNVIQTIRSYVAQSQECEPEEISTQLLFEDVVEELTAWHKFLSVAQTVEWLGEGSATAEQVMAYLRERLAPTWQARWRKAKAKNPPKEKPPTRYLHGGHSSVYRIQRNLHELSSDPDQTNQ